MSGFPSAVLQSLSHPTTHARTVAGQIGPGSHTNGVVGQLLDLNAIPGMSGRVTHLDDNAQTFGNGPSDINLPMVTTIALNTNPTVQKAHHATRGEVCFVHRDPTKTGFRDTHTIKSLYSMNQWLQSKAQRIRFGSDRDAVLLRNEINFAGVCQTGEAHAGHCITMIVERRARCWNFTNYISSGRGIRGDVKPGDQIFFLFRLYEYRSALDSSFDMILDVKPQKSNRIGSSRIQVDEPIPYVVANSSTPLDTECFWHIDAFVSDNGIPPPPALYMNDYYTGWCKLFGTVFEMYGNTSDNFEHTQRARRLMDKTEDSDEHFKDMRDMNEIVVMIESIAV
jgi:hypothetical protein